MTVDAIFNLNYYFKRIKEAIGVNHRKCQGKDPQAKALESLVQSLRQHKINFRNIGKHLASLGVTELKTIKVPKLGGFWTEASIENALRKYHDDSTVVKEIFLGLSEMMKKPMIFMNALTQLKKVFPERNIGNLRVEGGKLSLETDDGYVFDQRVRTRPMGRAPGIDLHLMPGKQSQEVYMSVGDDAWGSYLKQASPEYADYGWQVETGNGNPGGWQGQIATIALSRGGSGGTTLFEHGERNDGSQALQTHIQNSRPTVPITDGQIVNRVAHSLYYDQDPLFKKAV